MKNNLIISSLLLALGITLVACKGSKRDEHFGQPFTGLPTAAIPEVVTKPESFLGKKISIQGVLKRQCPATGCWFFLTDPSDPKAQEVKVEMGDTTPQLPARIGQEAKVEGQLIKFGEGYEFIGVAVSFNKVPQP
jgi:hypothetical protein